MVNTLIKSTLLLILIILIVISGLIIFDWLGLMSLRQEFAPILRLVGLNTPTANNDLSAEGERVLLNDTRLRQQLEFLEIEREYLEKIEKKLVQRSEELEKRELAITQIEEQLQQQLHSLAERENLYRKRSAKVEQIARNFNGMPPAQAVAQMNEMDALLVVDILRSADRIATQENINSLVPYWISQMPAERGAEINKLLVEKP